MRIFKFTLLLFSLLLSTSAVLGTAQLSEVTLTYWHNDSLLAVLNFSDQPSRTSSFLLTDHDRLVIDFRNTVNNLRRKKVETKPGPLLRTIRSSQFTPLPNPITRLVFDLEKPCRYDISKSNNTINIVLFHDHRRESLIESFPAEAEKNLIAPLESDSKTSQTAFVKDETVSNSNGNRIDLNLDEASLIDILNGLAVLAQSEIIYRACRPDTFFVSGKFSSEDIGEILDELLSSRSLSWSFSEDGTLIIAGSAWSE